MAVCTKFINQTVVISLDILKELETNFKMRYERLNSEDGPLSYSIFKKGTQIKNSSGAFEHRQINFNYIYMQRILNSENQSKRVDGFGLKSKKRLKIDSK